VPVPDLPPALDGLLIAAGQRHAPRLPDQPQLARHAHGVCDRAGARPDLIVITGDLVSGPGGVAAAEAELARLAAPLGIFAVLGNHDRGHTKAPRVRPPT